MIDIPWQDNPYANGNYTFDSLPPEWQAYYVEAQKLQVVSHLYQDCWCMDWPPEETGDSVRISLGFTSDRLCVPFGKLTVEMQTAMKTLAKTCDIWLYTKTKQTLTDYPMWVPEYIYLVGGLRKSAKENHPKYDELPPPECVHCGSVDVSTGHWRICSEHPANEYIAKITAERDRLREENKAVRNACEAYQTERSELYPRLDELKAERDELREKLSASAEASAHEVATVALLQEKLDKIKTELEFGTYSSWQRRRIDEILDPEKPQYIMHHRITDDLAKQRPMCEFLFENDKIWNSGVLVYAEEQDGIFGVMFENEVHCPSANVRVLVSEWNRVMVEQYEDKEVE